MRTRYSLCFDTRNRVKMGQMYDFYLWEKLKDEHDDHRESRKVMKDS